MDSQTEHVVDQWWSEVFGVDRDSLWLTTTVRPHAVLGDFDGWFVAWRGDGVHVSAPPSADEALLAQLQATHPEALSAPTFWASFAHEVGGLLRGPATHYYLDVAPDPAPDVHHVHRPDLSQLRARVTPEEWEESGVDTDDAQEFFVVHQDDELVAAAVLAPWRGGHLDIGILLAPEVRGTGLSDRVARTAAAYALQDHDFVRWRARQANQGSLAIARRLGFQPWCTQLAVRLS